MRKILLGLMTAATLLSATTIYAGPINDQLVEIIASPVSGLKLLEKPTGDFETKETFLSKHKEPTEVDNGSGFTNVTKRKVTRFENTSFKIIGNHDSTTTYRTGYNTENGIITAKIGKNENNYCLVTLTYKATTTPVIKADCTTATDFDFDSSATETLGSWHPSTDTTAHHLYFRTKTPSETASTDTNSNNTPPAA